MQINVVYDPSVNASNFAGGAAQMAQFRAAISDIVNLYDTLFTNNVTFTIDVGYGEYGQQTSANPGGSLSGTILPSNAVAANQPTYLSGFTYSQLVNALTVNEGGQQSAVEQAAFATLPGSDPLGGAYLVTQEQAEALGLNGGTSNATDLVGFATTPNGGSWYYGTGTPAAGQTDFIAAAEHEISEGMGRVALVGGNGLDSILGLFRYSSPGVRDTTFATTGTGNTAEFSIDGGGTTLGLFNNDQTQTIYSPPGAYDLGDWAPGQGPGPGGQDAYGQGNTGIRLPLTLSDTTAMNVIGWNLSFPSDVVPDLVTDWVPDGSPVSDMIVQSGGYQEIGSSGLATSTTVQSGGQMQVDTGGLAGEAGVLGLELVYGLDLHAVVSGGGTLVVEPGGGGGETTVLGGGELETFFHGAETSAVVSGVETVYGVDHGAVISAKGVQLLEAGASATAVVISSGGVQSVNQGAEATSTTVSSGGVAIVFQGGLASGAIVDSGGVQWVGYYSGTGKSRVDYVGGLAS